MKMYTNFKTCPCVIFVFAVCSSFSMMPIVYQKSPTKSMKKTLVQKDNLIPGCLSQKDNLFEYFPVISWGTQYQSDSPLTLQSASI